MTWSAQQYVQFEDERTRPVRNLLSAVPRGPVQTAIDLGCGPGNSTEMLLSAFPGAAISGLDSSPDMIAAARQRLPHVQFTVAPLESWDGPPCGVILANAVLQWIPGHDTVLPRLIGKLVPGGSLAVQMPDNLEETAHRLMRAVAADGPWAAKLAGAAAARTKIADAPWYYGLLQPLCRTVNLWRTTYYHILPGGPDAIVEWFKGSGLRPFLAPLDAAEQTAFLDRYRAAVAKAFPPFPNGAVLLPFPRLFIVATR